MEQPKRVLCIMDLSVVGRAAASSALPVLAACGVQACCLPTALFSTHTGGFGPVEKQDLAPFAAAALRQWQREGITFDSVLLGYLCSAAQFSLAEAAFAQYPAALKLADPAMADGGKLYGGLPKNAVARWRRLCRMADIITPNHTEAALLAGADPAVPPPDAAARAARLEALSAQGQTVVVTGIPAPNGGMAVLARSKADGTFPTPVQAVPQSYPGAGDAFTAALLGRLLRGDALPAAIETAVRFIAAAAAATYAGGGEPRHGLWLEPFLPMLSS